MINHIGLPCLEHVVLAEMIGIAEMVVGIVDYMAGQEMMVNGGDMRPCMGMDEILMAALDLEVCVGVWPIGHGVMQVCGCAGLRYAVRRRKGIGHMALWFSWICT